MAPDYLVRDGGIVARNLYQVLLGVLNTFAYGVGKVQSLSKSRPDLAVSVPTTTSARKLRLRPPLTVLDTGPTLTTSSLNSS